MPLLGLNISMLVGLANIVLGIISHILGMATVSWTLETYDFTKSIYRYGLFSACTGDICHYYEEVTPELRATQAFASLGLCLAVAALVTVLYTIISKTGQQRKTVLLLAVAILGSLACVSIAVCATVWAVTNDSRASLGLSSRLSYSFTLSICGATLITIGCWTLYITARRSLGHARR